ncbi:MAG: cysteine desulfurase [Hyphomicrobiaceae bacterium]|nr:cysteine desulfurase [Hyphomicrobiaceae bacterium]
MNASGHVSGTRIYLDHNATSPLRKRVREAMIGAMDLAGNASAVYKEGRAARSVVERSREKIAALIGANPNEVLFTSGGTEANLTALSPGLVAPNPAERRQALCFVSDVEHPSVRKGGRYALEQVRTIPVNSSGVVDLEAFIDLLDAHDIGAATSQQDQVPFMVSVMLANNETGAIQPVTEIAGIVLERGGLMHCDAVQALGRMPFDMASLGADLVTIAAHKIGGPKGVGALIGPGIDRVLNDPLMTGGGQEMRRRAGTENIVSIAGFATAAEISCEELAEREMVRFLRDRAESRLKAQHPDLVLFAKDTDRLENTSFMAIPGVLAEKLIIALDLDGIAISSGSACSSGKVTRSPVLAAMGVNDELARCAFRISFGPQNWLNDVDRLVGSIKKAVERMNRLKTLVGSQSTQLLTSKGSH